MIVPFPAGGMTDIVGRLIAQKLTKSWRQQVIVDNRGGTTGSDVTAKSPPGGYTLLVGTSITHAIAPSLYLGDRHFERHSSAAPAGAQPREIP